jgi:putative ABC transport system permease protein
MSPVDSILSFSPGALATPLLIAVGVAALALLAQALLAPHLARIGLRNTPRRPLRATLIIGGLMLATTFIASSLTIDDTISLAVRSVAVFNLGRVDEDVTGGEGPLGLYPADVGYAVEDELAKNALVADVAPALVAQQTLVADTTSREVRGGVAAIGMAPSEGGVFGALRDTPTGAMRSSQTIGAADAYLDETLATTLNARVGDRITLYSAQWAGRRYTYTVKAIVTGGPLGDAPAIVLSLPAIQAMAQAGPQINHIYIANLGDGLTGVGFSDDIASDAQTVLPGSVHVSEVKKHGVDFAVRAQSLFGKILTLYTLLALAIGLLLIFLIFTLLAAERRAELGVARALGMRRSQLIWMLLFEGATYDLVAAALGVLIGLGLGSIILALASPTLQRIGFPIQLALNPNSMIVAFSLGLICTLLTIAVAAWSVSHMTIAAALRDLPEPPTSAPALLDLARVALDPARAARRRLGACLEMLAQTVTHGLAPFALGYWMLATGVTRADTLWFAAGLSLMITGVTLLARAVVLGGVGWWLRGWPQAALRLARARLLADRLCALAIGAGLALYWSLPFDALVGIFGLPRFSGGIEIFFVAGVMMVAGCVLALAPNLDVALAPLSVASAALGRWRHVARIALVYPSQQRFRTGIGLALFAFTLFVMVVMDTIAASTTRNYTNLSAQAASYDLIGQPLFAPAGGVTAVDSAVARAAPSTARQIIATGEATPLPLGLIEPAARRAAWRFYPASIIQGSLLDGVGLTLAARATGYSTDAQVWQALRTHPGDVVIDASALTADEAALLGTTPGPPPGAAQFLGPPIAAGLPGFTGVESLRAQERRLLATTNGGIRGNLDEPGALAILSFVLDNGFALHDDSLRMSNVALGPGRIAPTTLWAADVRGGAVARLTVIGVVENSRGATYGLMGSPATFAPIEAGMPAPTSEYYYFKVAPGSDVHSAAYAIGSALLDDGFETASLQDALLDVNGARVFISQALVGLVGLTLLVGMAALAVSGSRAVVERRQQIGMLRALGFHRADVQMMFFIESSVVGAAGAALGIVFGLILCRNIFAVDFFEQFQSGLSLVVPWRDIGLITVAAALASLIAALGPAWQAGRVTPADALRYE